ncbi:sugar dehydrogenase [Amycolatopsis antarctica]|uniref:Sugar dehydrogenase n=1 Tax=Amycolatopsis antarctica TaxID=1854586 RepID=A0A263DCU0_9PSEU|nr:PQQ-dependent sugar dehydrogenase [Amycolatopsis antarctica]OZM75306.1 sugar dehydrogenase [Amycolatopsis antarctica]
MPVRPVISTLTTAVTAAAVLTVVTAPEVAEAAPSLPAGFVLTDLGTGQGQYNLTDFGFLPDESVLTTGKNGTVTWLAPGGAGPRPIAALSVFTGGDSGLLGIAIAPDYAVSRQIYTTRAVPRSGGGALWRLSRWTVTGGAEPTGLGAERTLLEIPADSDVHGMSDVEAGTDGTLWVSIGDSAASTYANPQAIRAQDLDQPYGKMLHLNPDGTGVAGNPFHQSATPGSTRGKVYASGLRSPFRFTLDPATGTPIVGDVGWNTFEEINLVRAGQNYKWPCWEGDLQPPGYREMAGCAGVANNPPLWQYPRSAGVSVTGGVVYRGDSYPQRYRGAYFFGDYVSQTLWTLTFDGTGRLTRAPESGGFAGGIGGPVSFGTAPNGDIVYADLLTGQLRRLSYAPGNNAPVAVIGTRTDPATRTVSFDGGASYDFDGDPLVHTWEFGDGSTATGATVTHTYAAAPERFTATLTVTDRLGAAGSATAAVVPANRGPELELTAADADDAYGVAEPVALTASATDAEDGPLGVEWSVREVHCSTESTCHSHPGRAASGPTYETLFTDHPDTRMDITATATDSAGVTSTRTYVAQPRRHRVTLDSSVSARLTLSPSGAASALVTAGATVTVEAAATALDGVASFERWDDGGPRSRAMTMPDRDLTLRATYLTPIDRRFATDQAVRAELGAAAGPELSDGGIRYRDHVGGRLYWTAGTGVREVHGAILERYRALGGHARFGVPTTDETTTEDRIGRFNHFTGTPATMAASLYWTPGTGAHAVWGLIRERWQASGWERGVLGYPTSDETVTPDGYGRYNHFTGQGMPASIYWTPGTGAHPIWGAIRARWAALGWERGPAGYPTSGETVTPDGYGRYNHFTGLDGFPASVYWTPGTGAHEVYGLIRVRWAAIGWERSYLGYPTSGEFGVPGGRRNDFQRGYVHWNAYQGGTIDRRY